MARRGPGGTYRGRAPKPPVCTPIIAPGEMAWFGSWCCGATWLLVLGDPRCFGRFGFVAAIPMAIH